ncbi:MAG: GNAT family N-acetyltransferase [Anaerolineae bacterium]|nr:GNAT family N-acetyltransferase [Anaerolineae bacterium]
MSEIRPLQPEDFDRLVAIAANAFPVLDVSSAEARERLRERLLEAEEAPHITHYGLFRNGVLLGGMRFFDFTMTFHTVPVPVGGIGMVCVDLAHKKQHIAKELLAYFHQHYLAQDAVFTLLYPFRPDFYYKMGYGYGPKMNHYHFIPTALPAIGDRSKVRFLAIEDVPAMCDSYQRYAARTHGMLARIPRDFERQFKSGSLRAVGYEDGQLTGYLLFDFKSRRDDNFLLNDLRVWELVAEDRAALLGLLAFLRAQADQAPRIDFRTHDETFHFLLSDPRNRAEPLVPSVYHESNVQGVGLMYRVLDARRVFAALAGHDFGGQTCTVRIDLTDTFLPQNAGATTVRVAGGRAMIDEEAHPDVVIALGVSEFSSLIMGVVDFETLYRYGLAEISDAHRLDVVTRIFAATRKPVCLTAF